MLSVKRTAPIEDLYLLNVSNYIKNIKITDNEQEQRLQLKKLCNFIETEIIGKLHCVTTKLSHESFDIDSPDFRGPVNYLNPTEKDELENLFLQCKESAIRSIFILITKCIFFGEERIGINSSTISNTIAHQIWIQILSNLYPSIFYKSGINDKTVYQQSLIKHKNVVDKLPAIGNSVVWISKQQTYNINGKRIYCPEYVELWMEYFLKGLTNPDSSLNTLIQSVKLLNLVLDNVKENKEALDKANISAKISIDSFITLIAILKSNDINSELRQKSAELFDSVSKAYETLKYLLFDQTTNVIQFKESLSNVFQILYIYLLSDPNATNQAFDRSVLDEFTNIIVLTLAKDPSLYNEWVNLYKQYQFQPRNIHLTKTIIKNIQDQQAQYLEKGEQLPTENRWRALDNDAFKKILYEIIILTEGHESDPEFNEMKKSIKTIVGKPEIVETVEVVEPVQIEPEVESVQTRSVEIPQKVENVKFETLKKQPREVRHVRTTETHPNEYETVIVEEYIVYEDQPGVQTVKTVKSQPEVKTTRTTKTTKTQQPGINVKTIKTQPEVHVETVEIQQPVEEVNYRTVGNVETQPEVHVETVEIQQPVEEVSYRTETVEAQPEVHVETVEIQQPVEEVSYRTETVETQPEVHVETVEAQQPIEEVSYRTEIVETQQPVEEVSYRTETVETQQPVEEVSYRTETIETQLPVEEVSYRTETIETQPEVHVETVEIQQPAEEVSYRTETVEIQQPVEEVNIETTETYPEEATYDIVEEELETTDRSITEVEEESEDNGINVYFEKPYYWNDEIYAYVYKYEDDFTPVYIREWPGVRIYPIGGEGDIYYYTLDKSYYDGCHRILFSDGNHQVSDVLVEGFDLIRNALYTERGFDRICKTIGEKNNILAFGSYVPIYYKPKEEWLKGPIYAHYRINDGKWTQSPGQEMSLILNGKEAALFVKANTNAEISVAFTNGVEWDNNYGQNFKVNCINDQAIDATI